MVLRHQARCTWDSHALIPCRPPTRPRIAALPRLGRVACVLPEGPREGPLLALQGARRTQVILDASTAPARSTGRVARAKGMS
jgi:hypothetical protein